MDNLQTQILEAWRIHNRTMMMVLDELTDEALKASMSTRGGRDIARQFAHIHAVRENRLSSFSKKTGQPLERFDPKESPPKKKLMDALERSGHVMEKYLAFCMENDGTVPNFKRGVLPMLSYYISHEAHHRGSVLLTVKTRGFKLTDTLKWGIWEWNKI